MWYIVTVHFVEAIFHEGVYTWILKIVTDGQTDSLTNLIKCVVVYRSYSYAFWSTSLWAPDNIYIYIYNIYITSVLPALHLKYLYNYIPKYI